MILLITDRLEIKANCEAIEGRIVFHNNAPIDIFDLSESKPENCCFALYLKTGEYVGHISILNKRKPFEFSVGIEKPYRKNGYMSEAIGPVIKWIVQNCSVESIVALVGPLTPEASRKILRRHGFMQKQEGNDEWWVLDDFSQMKDNCDI